MGKSTVRLAVNRCCRRLGLTLHAPQEQAPDQPKHEGLSAKDLLYYVDVAMAGPGEDGKKLQAAVYIKPLQKPRGTGPYFALGGGALGALRHLAAGRLDDVVLYAKCEV